MQLHELRPKHKLKRKKRVGRGGKRGTYSGRGMKGQKSRAGRKMKPVIRELIKRYPKLRGYKFKGKGKIVFTVNLQSLEKKFGASEIVSPKTLLDKKIIRKIKGKIPFVKILGSGEITKPLLLEGCSVSKQAKEKIEKMGGTIKIKKQK